MNRYLVRSLAATVLALTFSWAIAGSDTGNKQTWTVVDAGDFKQTFRVTTDANYQNNGWISVVGMQSLFGKLELDLYSSPQSSLTGSLTGKSLGAAEKVVFQDSAFAWNLAASSTYLLKVSGNALSNGVTYDMRSSQLQISPVPEPETYSMLLGGLGLIGAIALRRSRKS